MGAAAIFPGSLKAIADGHLPVAEQPNIVLIIADDQGYADLGCAGLARDVATPNLDRLAARGTRFTQAYATSPICNPSRAGLITGCYQQRYGTFWYGGKGIHDPRFATLPETLAKQGYVNGLVGKVHYGSHDHKVENRNFPLNHGFDEFYGFTSPRKHYINHRAEAEAEFQRIKKENGKRGQSLRQGPMWEGREKKDTTGFSSDLFGRKACEFIERHREEKFFLQISFNAVHNFTHQLPESYLDEHDLEGYTDWDPAKEEYYDWYKKGRFPNNPEGRAHYLGQLHYLDRAVGQVTDRVRALGLEEKTIILFVGDNGGSTPIYADNGPLRGSKYTLYEGGIRVPMIVSWPGRFAEGAVCDNMLSAMDLYPTICSAAGAEIPGHVEGVDLAPLLSGERPALAHDTLIWDTGQEVAVRQGKWKMRVASSNRYARYEMVELEEGEFLHDLEADPGEKTNLAEEHPEILERLKGVHRKWRASLGEK